MIMIAVRNRCIIRAGGKLKGVAFTSLTSVPERSSSQSNSSTFE